MRILITVLIVSVASGADVLVNTLDGKGPLRGISLAANATSISLHSAAGRVVKVATAQVVEIVTVPPPQPPPLNSRPFEVRLTDGSRLRGVLTKAAADTLRLRSPLLAGTLEIDLDHVVSVRRVDDTKIPGASLIAPLKADDVAYTLTGARTKGTLQGFTESGVIIDRELGARSIPYAKLAALFIDTQPMAPLQGLHVVARLSDGSAVILKGNFNLAQGTLAGTTPSGLQLRIRTKHIEALGFMGGAFVHLSDLKPQILRKPYFPLPKGPTYAAMLDFVCPVRMDKSPDGRAITVNKRRYFKGIGLRPHTELTFALNGKYRFFQAACGIDDEVFGPRYGRSAGAGSVVFSVYGDGKLLFASKPVVGGKAPEPLRLEVANVRVLKLVVGLVPKDKMPQGQTDSPELDNAVWARPLLIR